MDNINFKKCLLFVLFALSLSTNIFSQRKIKGVFKTKVGYTIAELSFDSTEKVFYLVDIFFIDSTENKKYKVIYDRATFINSNKVCEEDLQKLKKYELYDFDFDRSYSNFYNDSLIDVVKVIGANYARVNETNIYHISKSLVGFYVIKKVTKYLKLRLSSYILCNGHVRQENTFAYPYDNKKLLPLEEGEVEVLGFNKIQFNSINFKICQ